jgi:hypothetical protein
MKMKIMASIMAKNEAASKIIMKIMKMKSCVSMKSISKAYKCNESIPLYTSP